MSPEDRVEQLLKAANDAAQPAQTFYTTFLLLGTYIAIIIGSTTDEQFLKISPVTLPLLNVGLPILWFYALIPWLFLLAHFNLLLQLYLLACKLHPPDAAIAALGDETGQEQQRIRLFPFPFGEMLIGRHRGRMARRLLTLVVLITVILLPLFLLSGAQIRFLPYHSEGITWSQRLAILADVALLWIFWPMTVGPGGSAREWWRQFVLGLLCWVPVRVVEQLSARKSPRRTLYLGLGLLRWVPIRAVERLTMGRRPRRVVYTVEYQKSQPRMSAEHARGSFTLLCASPLVLLLSLFAVMPGEYMEGLTPRILTDWIFNEKEGGILHRNLYLKEKILVLGELSAEVVAGLQSQNEKDQKEAMKKVAGLSLSNRDLRFADLRYALLPKADLRGAQIQSAKLESTYLREADLGPLDPDNPKLTSVQLQGANLRNAQFQGANLRSVQFQGANLVEAQFHGAIMKGTLFKDAQLRRAQFQGADLESADFQGADFKPKRAPGEPVQFQGANLQNAKFQGADLSGFLFHGVNLEEAWLQGANLGDAQLQGANLKNAVLNGANLRGAQLQGVNLVNAQLQGVNLVNAQLQDADLRLAEIGGADFSDANLSLSDLRSVVRTPEKPDNLEKARTAKGALCDENLQISDCLPETEIAQYYATLASYLGDLGCNTPDAYIATGLINRARSDDNLGSALATLLLKPNCTGGAALPEETRKMHQRISKQPITPPEGG